MTYIYKCKWCGKRKEVERKLMEPYKPVYCDCINKPMMYRDFQAENKGMIIPGNMKAV